MRRLGVILLIIGAVVVSLFLYNNSNHETIRMHWILLHPKIQPQARPPFVYMSSDPELKGLVYYDALTRETFLLSRGQWHLVHSRVNPDVGYVPTIAYDPMGKYLLLFGEKARTVKGRVIQESQTWILSANGWRRIRTATNPPPLNASSLGCDTVTGQCVLFGGVFANPKNFPAVHRSAETWLWNGSTWKQIHTLHHPQAKFYASIAWDSYTHQLILFGGVPSLAIDGYSNTWIWGGKSWHIVSRSRKIIPDIYPESMTYDPNIKGLILSDLNGPVYEWFWDGKSWKLLAPNFVSPPLNEYNNSQVQMQYDNADHCLVLYVMHLNKFRRSSERTYILK